MEAHRKRLERLLLLVNAIKRHQYPNAESFGRELQARGADCGTVAGCTRTIKRDILYLRRELSAPISFDTQRRGYYLTEEWAFPFVVLRGEQLFATLFSGQLTQPLLPPTLRSALTTAMEVQLAAGNPEGLPLDMLGSVILASHTGPELNADICDVVLHGWRVARTLAVQYQRPGGEASARQIDVHALFLHDSVWYARAWDHDKQALRSFALHRIKQATLLPGEFVRRAEVLEELRQGQVFDYEPVHAVRVRCPAADAEYFAERAWFPGQSLTHLEDGSLELSYAVAPREPLVHWVLGHGGRLQVLAPAAIRTAVHALATALATSHA